MALVVNTNMQALNALRHLEANTSVLSRTLERLASGLRINNAADDAAGLAIAARLGAQVRSLNQALRNANDGIALLGTAEGALAEITNILTRMKELAVQAANDTVSASDRASLQDEVSALIAEINRIATQTRFGGQVLLDGTVTSFTFQVGDQSTDTITVTPTMSNFQASNLGVSGTDNVSTVDVSTVSGATAAMAILDQALGEISSARGEFGAAQNRLMSTIANVSVVVEKVADARSRIMDADFAAETAALTRAQILQQAGVAVLAQANLTPQAALALLRQ